MADVRQPLSIFSHQIDSKHIKSSVSLSNDKKLTFQICANLMSIMFNWQELNLSWENMTYILRSINKLLPSCIINYIIPDSKHSDVNIINSNTWKDLIRHLREIENEKKENDFCYEGLPISFEIACLHSLNKMIEVNSANGTCVNEAIELSGKLLNIYFHLAEVSKCHKHKIWINFRNLFCKCTTCNILLYCIFFSQSEFIR